MWRRKVRHRYEPPRAYSYEAQVVKQMCVLFFAGIAVAAIASAIVGLVLLFSTALVSVQ